MTPEPASVAGSLLPVAASLVAIVIVILALGYLMRRMPSIGRAAGGLRVRAALPVGARERVLWIEAGGKHLLVGVTANSVRTLHEFSEPPPEANTPADAGFAQQLRRLLDRSSQ